MVARRARRTRRWIARALVALAAAAGGCSTHDTFTVGRPCSASEPCGPGAVCDQLRGVCIAAEDGSKGPPDGTPHYDVTSDGAAGADSARDAPGDGATDAPRDAFITPDGGCPATAPTQCGAVCVDITSNAKHCNGCNKACAANERCSNSACSCRAGYDDCDGNSDNGCECSTGCNGSSCKSVGCNPSAPGACGGDGSYCDNGTCRTCASGYYNCDGTGGCECTRPCVGGGCGCDPNVTGWCGDSSKYCNTSTNVCTSCPSGKQNCNRLGSLCECSNGCSGASCTPPPCSTTTAWSCGTSVLRYCSSGSCTSCASGKRNCNGILSCECGPNTVCSATSCACASGYCNENASLSDGCEGRIGTNSHCTSCGDACNLTCANGCRQICTGSPKRCSCPPPPCPF